MKKILFCASTLSHIRSFHLPYLRAFRERGYQVWVAADQEGVLPDAHRVIALPFRKSMASPLNVLALWQIRALLRQERFDLVSVHTGLAGAVVRAAALTLPRRPAICYTCHGYLFREGDGLRTWKYLLPERICAPVTDLLLVMNGEDEEIARRYHLGKQLRFIDGMGVDLSRFVPLSPGERVRRRTEWGAGEEELLLIYAAEFSERKNQALLIRALARARTQAPHLRLMLAGEGETLELCRDWVGQLGLEDRVTFLGRVERMEEIYPLCDAVVSSSRSEGLPFHLMEAMSCGLPAVVTDIKGHRELVEEGGTGLRCTPEDENALAEALVELARHPDLRAQFGQRARERVRRYDLAQVLPQVMACYESLDLI